MELRKTDGPSGEPPTTYAGLKETLVSQYGEEHIIWIDPADQDDTETHDLNAPPTFYDDETGEQI